jgi:hypothetical protein
MESMMKTINNDTLPKTTKPPEEIIRLFNSREIDKDWSLLATSL